MAGGAGLLRTGCVCESFLMGGENKLIERIRVALASRIRFPASSDLRLGIGDDAAVLRLPRPPRRAEWVLTCDAFLENVHFLAHVHPADAVGYKSLARAASDLAAMGAAPRFFLLSLALPAWRTGKWLDQFLAGMARAARKFRLLLAGGDTSRHPTLAISVTLLGEVPPGRAVTRAGAHPGDLIYISGTLGLAQLGLELILRGLHPQRRWKRLLRPHLYPEPRLALGQWLSRERLASAMIDTSDGLSTDLGHLCAASGVGARLWADRLPMVRVPAALRARGFDPLRLALHGGEDYELLFTLPQRLRKKIPAACQGLRVTRIGAITREKRIYLLGLGSRPRVLVPQGWDAFRSDSTERWSSRKRVAST
jgi:thiamine-monophosphate kinase